MNQLSMNGGSLFYLREALRLETRVKRVIFLYRDTSENRKSGNKIEPNSPRDLIQDSFPLPETSLSVLIAIRVLLKICQITA